MKKTAAKKGNPELIEWQHAKMSMEKRITSV